MDLGRFISGVVLLSVILGISIFITTETGSELFSDVVEAVTDWLARLVD